jgi:hypothetical protein
MIEFRTDLSAPGLWLAVNDYFCGINDPRMENGNTEIPLASALMAGGAMFALKFASLLQFDKQRVDPTIAHNLEKMFFVTRTPSDTQLRDIIDDVAPETISGAFDVVFSKAQRGKVLEGFTSLKGGYLLALDGTGYFESHSIHCDSCCEKTRRDGSLVYYHQFLPAVIVHPNQKQVIPLGAEPIFKQDGATKNDCEQTATIRLLKRIRESHPKLKLIIVQDGLHSKGPHIAALRELDMDFIIIAKESDHGALFNQIRMFDEFKEVEYVEIQDEKICHRFRFKNNVWLNGSSDQKVNVLEYWEVPKDGQTRHWAWVTSIEITKDNVMEIMKGGRARWRIENEAFNTLKNQGYQLEHNFGHGDKNLTTNLALLMLLAFTIDQLQEYSCQVFKKAREVWDSRILLWEKMRAYFAMVRFPSWAEFFDSLINKRSFVYDTS